MGEIAKRLEDFPRQIIEVVRGFVDKATAAISARVDALEKRIGELPAELKGDKGEPGEKGEAGEPGADGINGKDGANGIDGKDAVVDYEQINGFVVAEFAVAAKGLQDTIDGMVPAVVKSAIEALPKPKDGLDGIAGKDGLNGMAGEDGSDGRDAAELDILSGIKDGKRYERGTWARHAGGLVRAFRDTDPITDDGLQACGWEVMVNGIKDFAVMQGDDARTFQFGMMTTSGQMIDQRFVLPVMLYRELYVPDATYKTGDVVTWNGSMYVAMKDTAERPGASTDWRLSVKHGRDGKDGDAQKPAVPRHPVSLK